MPGLQRQVGVKVKQSDISFHRSTYHSPVRHRLLLHEGWSQLSGCTVATLPIYTQKQTASHLLLSLEGFNCSNVNKVFGLKRGKRSWRTAYRPFETVVFSDLWC